MSGAGESGPRSEPRPEELDEAAEKIFEITKMAWMARSQQRPQKGQPDLTESEFLALDSLVKAAPEPLTVGEIQRRIRVLPAQMSRVIRSLENKAGKALIRCRINPKDKRKVDVSLTRAGRSAHASFRESRLSQLVEMVAHLTGQDRSELMRILQQIQEYVRKRLES